MEIYTTFSDGFFYISWIMYTANMYIIISSQLPSSHFVFAGNPYFHLNYFQRNPLFSLIFLNLSSDLFECFKFVLSNVILFDFFSLFEKLFDSHSCFLSWFLLSTRKFPGNLRQCKCQILSFIYCSHSAFSFEIFSGNFVMLKLAFSKNDGKQNL